MPRLTRAIVRACAVALLAAATRVHAQTIDPFFAAHYSFTDLGSVPGVPPFYGGINFALTSGGTFDYDTLIIGGSANDVPGALYSVGVVRDASHHIVGFGGAASFYAEAAFIDAGLTYGPGNVLFLSRWPVDEIGQQKPGSAATDKVVDMSTVGVPEASGGMTFVPGTHPGAGQLKYLSWPTGLFYTLGITPDGSGTFDLTSATLETTLIAQPEAFAYVPIGSSGFAAPSMLVSELGTGDPNDPGSSISAYVLDANGNPIASTRRLFMTDFAGAEGALVDPVTGDMLFSTFAGGDRVVVVHGFAALTTPEPSSVVLCATGLLGVLVMVRRRRRA